MEKFETIFLSDSYLTTYLNARGIDAANVNRENEIRQFWTIYFRHVTVFRSGSYNNRFECQKN